MCRHLLIRPFLKIKTYAYDVKTTNRLQIHHVSNLLIGFKKKIQKNKILLCHCNLDFKRKTNKQKKVRAHLPLHFTLRCQSINGCLTIEAHK